MLCHVLKNFNRCNSHGHHDSKRHELKQHAHSHGSHGFTCTLYINTVTATWCEAPAQLLFFSACWVVLCFRNPLNSDMDYRICSVRTWSFLCVRIHTGVRHTDSESAQQFWLGTTPKKLLCSWQDSNHRLLDLESDALLIEPPHP